MAYKHGQSNDFKVFPSHHLYREGKIRWPENGQEAARTLFEAMAFGGHVPCTTWGIRMDGSEDKTLWKRDYFVSALDSAVDFLDKHKDIFSGVKCNAKVGVYMNRECMAADYNHAWYSLNGIIQTLLLNHIPFRLIDTDEKEKLEGIELLIIPQMRLVSNEMLKVIKEFAVENKVIACGEVAGFDKYFLRREKCRLDEFYSNSNVTRFDNDNEKILDEDLEKHGNNVLNIPAPNGESEIVSVIDRVYNRGIKISGSRFIGVDTFVNAAGKRFIHLLNYDNDCPVDIEVEVALEGENKNVSMLFPKEFGGNYIARKSGNKAKISITGFNTYGVICIG
jgi:hypothetical protein